MSIFQPIMEQKEFSAQELLSLIPATDTSSTGLKAAVAERLLRRSLRDGVELLVWTGRCDAPLHINVCDDSNSVSLSYSLRGSFQCRFEDSGPEHLHKVPEGAGSINYNPGRSGEFRQGEGEFEIVTVMLHRDVFSRWEAELDTSLKVAFDRGRCFAYRSHCSAELRATAQALGKAVRTSELCPEDSSNRKELWLLGNSLVFASLLLDSLAPGTHCTCDFSISDREKLLHARDLLLQNLNRAPTIDALAKASELSAVKLKRGFRQLFNSGVYGLFQRERMCEAHRRLCSGGQSVMLVASELGYTNASHFAAAFFKEFGVKPSQIKRK